VAVIDDCLNMSTAHPVPHSTSFTHEFTHVRPLSAANDSSHSVVKSIPRTGYASFVGPTFPTPAEVATLSSLSSSPLPLVVGINSIAIIYACASIGLATYGVVAVNRVQPSFDLSPNAGDTIAQATTLLWNWVTNMVCRSCYSC
jgi:hypothetical protein